MDECGIPEELCPRQNCQAKIQYGIAVVISVRTKLGVRFVRPILPVLTSLAIAISGKGQAKFECGAFARLTLHLNSSSLQFD